MEIHWKVGKHLKHSLSQPGGKAALSSGSNDLGLEPDGILWDSHKHEQIYHQQFFILLNT